MREKNKRTDLDMVEKRLRVESDIPTSPEARLRLLTVTTGGFSDSSEWNCH